MINSGEPAYPHKLRRLYWPFLALAEACHDVLGTVAGAFEWGSQHYTIPRFSFFGPMTEARRIRVGFFALLQGNAPAGTLALQRLLNLLVDNPVIARGYELVFYPVCNPTGFEDDTRCNRAGRELNREFWRGSSEPEVKILESELQQQRFDGIVALNADETGQGLHGHAIGGKPNEQLLALALRASAGVLPLDLAGIVEGFSVTGEKPSGELSPPPGQNPPPFEIVFETPARAPLALQVEAACQALCSVLDEGRAFISNGGES
jgi:murein peptide amidase A